MEKIDLNKRNLLKFGITMGIAFLVIAIFVLIRHKHSALPLAIIAVIFSVAAGIAPGFLKPAYIIWMRFAFALSWINTRLILIIIFYLVFTPIGLIMRLCRVDLLERGIDKHKASYWKKKEPGESPGYERQF